MRHNGFWLEELKLSANETQLNSYLLWLKGTDQDPQPQGMELGSFHIVGDRNSTEQRRFV